MLIKFRFLLILTSLCITITSCSKSENPVLSYCIGYTTETYDKDKSFEVMASAIELMKKTPERKFPGDSDLLYKDWITAHEAVWFGDQPLEKRLELNKLLGVYCETEVINSPK